MQWAEMILELKGEFDREKRRGWWAEAMVEKYGGVPAGYQWTTDPIVSRLDPVKYATLHDEMMPMAVEAAKKRSKQ